MSQSLIKQGRPKAPGAACRVPAANLEDLVETRLCGLLQDPAVIYEVARAVSTDMASRKALLAAAADLGRSWPSRSATERRAVFSLLVGRVTVRTETVEIEVQLAALPKIVQADAIQIPAKHDVPTTFLSVPAQLKRTGMQNQLLVDAGPGDPREPDRSLLRLLAQAHQFERMIMAGQGKEMRELAREAGVNPSYFARIFRLTFLAPAITHPSCRVANPRQPAQARRPAAACLVRSAAPTRPGLTLSSIPSAAARIRAAFCFGSAAASAPPMRSKVPPESR